MPSRTRRTGMRLMNARVIATPNPSGIAHKAAMPSGTITQPQAGGR